MKNLTTWIREGIAHPWPAVYLRIMAVIMLLGALSHSASILGVAGGPWAAKPLQIRVADLVLLSVNLVLGWGLWRRRFWAAIGWMAAVVLFQAVPILFFAESFAAGPRERVTLYVMLATNVVLLGIFFALLSRRKEKRGSPR